MWFDFDEAIDRREVPTLNPRRHSASRVDQERPLRLPGCCTRRHARCQPWTTSHPLTSTSGVGNQSCNKEKGSNARHSKPGACNTANPPPEMTNQMSQILS